jgi:L-ascorbate metabolism protein UlaG (beta-lactamase superfamily)
MDLIKPKQKDAALLEDIKSFTSATGFKVWWLAQSGFLIKWQGKHLLFDPYLSDSLTLKYQHTDKPHVRLSEMAVNPAALDFIDIFTSSHNHTDHLDADTLIPIISNNPHIKFIIPEANRAFVANRVKSALDFPIGLNDGLSVEQLCFTITGVPAAHNELERNEKGECLYMGFIVQFGGYSVYHSGDTIWFDGLENLLQPYNLDIAFLPINGNRPERKVAGNLSALEAAQLGKAIGARLVIPHHYDLFAFNTEDPQRFVEACAEYGTPYTVLEIGEGLAYEK